MSGHVDADVAVADLADVDHRQQVGAALLAHLLTRGLPRAHWTISRVSGKTNALAKSAADVHAWAAVLGGGTTITRWDGEDAGTGTIIAGGPDRWAGIEVWYPLDREELAALDAAAPPPAAADQAAEGCACPEPCPVHTWPTVEVGVA